MKEEHDASDGGLVVRQTADGPRSIPRVEPKTMAQKLRAFGEVPPDQFADAVRNARTCADVIALSTIAGAMDPKNPDQLAYAREFSDRAYGKAGPSHEQPSDEASKSTRRAAIPMSDLQQAIVVLRKAKMFEEASKVSAELARQQKEGEDAD